MYSSGRWEGFWVQEEWGRQAMTPFTLRFTPGEVTGEGRDAIGRFRFTGQYDESTGAVRMIKQYIGRHQVLYIGKPDGEGSIQGTWSMGKDWTGPFLIRPIKQVVSEDAPIMTIE